MYPKYTRGSRRRDGVCPDTVSEFVQCSPFTNIIHFRIKKK